MTKSKAQSLVSFKFRPIGNALLAAALFLGAPAMAQASSLAADSADDASVMSQSVLARTDAPLASPNDILFASDVNVQIATLTEVMRSEPSKGGRIQSILKRALALLGTPYRWGGTGTDGFDCSGLVGYVFRTALGIELPRVSREMVQSGQNVDRGSLNAGDLVFFSRSGKRVDHVGIYVGDGQFVHAPRTGKDVMVSRLDAGYWSGKFMQARRVDI